MENRESLQPLSLEVIKGIEAGFSHFKHTQKIVTQMMTPLIMHQSAIQNAVEQLKPIAKYQIELQEKVLGWLKPIANGQIEMLYKNAVHLANVPLLKHNVAQAIAVHVVPLDQNQLETKINLARQMAPLAEKVLQIRANLAVLDSTFSEATRNIDALTNVVGKYLSPAFDELFKIKEEYRRYFNQLAGYDIGIDTYRNRYLLMLVKLGWVPVTAISPDKMRELVNLYDEEGVELVQTLIDELFVKLYDENKLLKILDEWKRRPILKSRIRILEAAIKNHITGDYWSAVPTILPQIEGMIAKAKNHVGHMGGSELKRYIHDITKGDDISLEALRRFITNELLATFQHGKIVMAQLSRHAILHGADVEYGTAANSLKAILLFDHLQELLFEGENELVEINA